MSTRSANKSLKGYYYQFDKTIIEFLSVRDKSRITVEGIEDIDIDDSFEKAVIQCKYLASQKYKLSLLRVPVIAMLNNFLDGHKLQYYLFTHFGDDRMAPKKIDLPLIKQILTYKQGDKQVTYYQERKITDFRLQNFLKRLHFVQGPSFDKQHDGLRQLIGKEFHCSSTEEVDLYYNNALSVIFSLAIKDTSQQRTINKRDFKKKVDTREILFSQWYYVLLGKEQYLKKIKKSIKHCSALKKEKNKMMILDNLSISSTKFQLSLLHFIKNLIQTYFRPGLLRSATPWTLIFDVDDRTLTKIKRKLIVDKIRVNDGREDIIFNSEFFNDQPVTNTKQSGNKSGDIIKKVSYDIRILSAKNFLNYNKSIFQPDVIFCFTEKHPDQFKITSDTRVFHIKIDTLEDIAFLFDIK